MGGFSGVIGLVGFIQSGLQNLAFGLSVIALKVIPRAYLRHHWGCFRLSIVLARHQKDKTNTLRTPLILHETL